MNVLETKTIRTEVRKRVELSGGELRKLIKTATGQDLPARAEIFVEVPGGADWSNTSLNIDNRTPVIITWTGVSESNG